MRAVVAVAPIHDFYSTPHRFAALGAHTVADILRALNIQVCLFNFPLRNSHALALPAYLGYLEPFIMPEEQGKASFFTKYQHFGPLFDMCACKIMAVKPEIVFLSCFAFCYADQTISLARAIKKVAPTLPIVAGGCGAAAFPDYFLKQPGIDLVLCGEAETVLAPFINAFSPPTLPSPQTCVQIPGLFFKTADGEIARGPVPEQTHGDQIKPVIVPTHQTKNAHYFSTMLSRGCPKKCRFCANHISMGTTWRRPDYQAFFACAESALAPFCESGRQLYLNFEDDNFLLEPEPFFALCKRLQARFPGILFLAENGIDYRELDETSVALLIELGFKKFNISLAALDAGIAAEQTRTFDDQRYQAIARMLAQNNIPLTTYFICGLPGETRQTIAHALAFLAQQPTLVGISPFYAVPGMADFLNLKIFQKTASNLCCGSSCFPWAGRVDNANAPVTTKTVVTAFRLSRYINCTRLEAPTPIEKELVQKIKKEKQLYTILGKRKNETMLVQVENMDQELVDTFFNAVL